MATTYWGFDTASTVTSSMISCLAENGAPTSEISFVLRYLDTVSGEHNGLTSNEVSYIHGLGISIGLIYGDVPHEPLTFQDGVDAANAAAALASDLGVPESVTIYVDLGTSYEDYITATFIEGYAYQLSANTAYHSGFYAAVGDTYYPAFDTAFNEAQNNSTYGTYVHQSQLWGNEPEPGCSTIADRPAYDVNAVPNSDYGQPQVWQYAESCGCNVDEDESIFGPDVYRWWTA